MFQKAYNMQELNAMKQKKEAKLRSNKKQLGSREMTVKRMKINAAYQDRAQNIIGVMGFTQSN